MKTLFIEARSKAKIAIRKGIELLPLSVDLFSTVQFLGSVDGVRKQLEASGRIVHITKTKQSIHPAQILGCSMPRLKGDCALFIGDGSFHPIALSLAGKPVFMLGQNGSIRRMKEETDMAEKRKKAGIARFLISEKIGILVSTKSGQNRLRDAEKLRHSIEAGGRKAYIFISDSIDYTQLENFNFIQCWVNTACPRISVDDYERFNMPVINLDDLDHLSAK